jgi:hypothetical protein
MTGLRQIVDDVARALGVLAIVVFALGATAGPGPQIGASRAVGAVLAQLAAGELCGGGFGGDQPHVGCHACRTDVPLLPPAPCLAEPVRLAAGPTSYAGPSPFIALMLQRGPPPSRGPPTA